jgi:hypothetical protein
MVKAVFNPISIDHVARYKPIQQGAIPMASIEKRAFNKEAA